MIFDEKKMTSVSCQSTIIEKWTLLTLADDRLS